MADSATILSSLLSNVDDSYQKTIGYPMYDILAAFALSLADTDAQLADAIESLNPDNLSGDELTKYVYQRRGIVRRAATSASATLEIVGTGTIERGAVFETESGLRFEADEESEIDGSGTITVTCIAAGSSGNVGANSIKRMPVTIAGIISCTNPEPASGGYDEESDADLLDRFYLSLREPAVSGNIAHYKQWALEVAGVGMVQVYPLARGANTVEVMILDDSHLPADESLIKAVQDYIDPDSSGTGSGVAPIGAHCYVIAPETLTVNVSVTVVPAVGYDREIIEGAVDEQLSIYLAEICMERDYISYGKMCAYMAAADGVDDFSNLTINGQSENISIPERTVAILGEVTISYDE